MTFGLAVIGPGDPEPAGRAVRVTVAAAPAAGWPADAERLVDLREPGGAPFLSVTRASGAYLIDAPAHGTHRVSADGRAVRVGAADRDRARLLVAQTLPTAAALQGLDVFHAGAVRTPRGVVAISGPSGSGKSTLAAALVAAGAGEPFADDVLAVEPAPAGVRAHAGAVAAAPAPLALVVLLDRTRGAGPVRWAGEGDLLAELLGAAFVPHVDARARLLARLDVCARLLREGRARRLVVPEGAAVEATTAVLAEALGVG